LPQSGTKIVLGSEASLSFLVEVDLQVVVVVVVEEEESSCTTKRCSIVCSSPFPLANDK
jgi:hypothetical protein